jgi:hypothetical protein
MPLNRLAADAFLQSDPGIWRAATDALAGRRSVDLSPRRLAAAARRPGAHPQQLPTEHAILTALVLGAYNAMSDAAVAAVADSPPNSPLQRWVAICQGVRGWAIAHPDKYMLIWGQPVPGFEAPPETMAAGARTVSALVDTLRQADAAGALITPAGATKPMSAGMRANVGELSKGLLSGLPDWLIGRLLVAWTQLHGMVGFEVNGHIVGVAADPAAFFNHAAEQMGLFVGIAGQS